MKTIKEMKEEHIIKKAKAKAKKLREFYSHLRSYLIVNSIFFIINWITDPNVWWILYPVIGWGFCLTIHAIDALSSFEEYDDEWEERKTKELVKKYNNR